jgi:dTDP-4-amino-4,6-dideoxygalactose transaminase
MRVPFFGIAATLHEDRSGFLALAAEQASADQQLQGPRNRSFERAVAARVDRRAGVALGSGTDALAFALRAIGVGRGDRVLVTSLSFIASASSILAVGARPVFVDIDPETLLMLPADLERKISAGGPARALLAVHLFGRALPASIFRIAEAHGIPVVEDAAQALGSVGEDGIPAGRRGLVSCLSFDPTKILGSLTSGGMALTDDPELEAKLRGLSFHGRAGSGFESLGYNSQLPELSAGFLELRLGRLDSLIAARWRLAQTYHSLLRGLPGLSLPALVPPPLHSWQKYVVLAEDRAGLQRHLAAHGVEAKPQYTRPLYREPLFGASPEGSPCPASEHAAARALGLPIYPALAENGGARYVADTVRAFYA